MRRTLQEQIAANRRASIAYSVLLVLLLTTLGGVFTAVYAPEAWLFGALGAAGLGVVLALIANRSGPSIVLRISGAREATAAEDQVLRNVVEEMAIAAGLPLPKVYVIDDPAPNAFATGRDPQSGVVAVTTGLLERLDRDELQGVVAHEMAHIRNYDVRFMTVIALVAGLIPLMADIFMRSLWYSGGGRRRGGDKDQGQVVLLVIGLALAILAPIFAALLEMAVSRKREYLADATAAEFTRYPEGLARALKKISTNPQKLQVANRATMHMFIVNPLHLSGRGTNLLSTHPPTEARIAALMGLAGNYRQTPLDGEEQTALP
jgi:heat shock protein HtpX